MQAVLFLIDTLISLAILAFLLRLLLQWARADFRNPAARGLLRLTNPVLVPLRRLLPAVGPVDTASVLIVLLLVMLRTAVPTLLLTGQVPPLLPWLQFSAVQLASTVLWTYFLAIFLYALLSLVSPDSYSPLHAPLAALCEPILRRFRRLIPPLAGMDFSPMWAGIIIQALLILLR